MECYPSPNHYRGFPTTWDSCGSWLTPSMRALSGSTAPDIGQICRWQSKAGIRGRGDKKGCWSRKGFGRCGILFVRTSSKRGGLECPAGHLVRTRADEIVSLKFMCGAELQDCFECIRHFFWWSIFSLVKNGKYFLPLCFFLSISEADDCIDYRSVWGSLWFLLLGDRRPA